MAGMWASIHRAIEEDQRVPFPLVARTGYGQGYYLMVDHGADIGPLVWCGKCASHITLEDGEEWHVEDYARMKDAYATEPINCDSCGRVIGYAEL